MLLLLGNVQQPKDASVIQLKLEQRVGAFTGRTFEDDVHLELGFGELLGIDVHVDVDVRRLVLGAQRTRRVRVLEREILGELNERVERGLALRCPLRRSVTVRLSHDFDSAREASAR